MSERTLAELAAMVEAGLRAGMRMTSDWGLEDDPSTEIIRAQEAFVEYQQRVDRRQDDMTKTYVNPETWNSDHITPQSNELISLCFYIDALHKAHEADVQRIVELEAFVRKVATSKLYFYREIDNWEMLGSDEEIELAYTWVGTEARALLADSAAKTEDGE